MRVDLPVSVQNSTRYAVNHLAAYGGFDIAIGAATSSATAGDHEIVVQPATQAQLMSVCGNIANLAGCTYYSADSQFIYKAVVMVGTNIIGRPAELPVVLHELGHAVGLSHYGYSYGGATQIMNPSVPVGTNDYQAGDRGGLATARVSGQQLLAGHNPYGTFDSATATNAVATSTGITVKGWALDPDVPANNVLMRATIDGVATPSFYANVYRPDVNIVHRGVGNYHGFQTLLATTPGRHTVCVTAPNAGLGTTDVSLGCANVVVPALTGASALSTASVAGTASVTPQGASNQMGRDSSLGPVKIYKEPAVVPGLDG